MGVVRLFLLVLAMLLLAVPVKADIPGQLNALNESLGQLRGKLDTLQTKLEELGKKVTVTAVFPTPQGLGISEDKIWRLNQSTEKELDFFEAVGKDKYEAIEILTCNVEKIYSSKPLKGVKYLKISGCEFLENLNLYQVFPDLRYLYVDDCLLQNLSLPRTLEILFITNNAEKINQLIIPDECKQIVLSGKGVSLPVESLWIPATYDEQSILKQVKTDSWNVLSRILENDEGLILYNEKDKVLQLNEQKLTKNKVRKYTPEGVDRNQYDIASFKANAQSIKSMYTEPKKLILYECEFNSNCTYVLVDDKTVTNFQIIRAKNLSKVGLIQNNELKSVEFTECNNLTYIDVEKFEKLEEIVFNNCEGLNGFQVLKDQGLNLVKKLIFKDCTNLSTVMIQELPSLESISLAGCNGLNTLRLLVLTNLKTLVLPRSKKDILKLDNIRSCNKDLSIEWK